MPTQATEKPPEVSRIEDDLYEIALTNAKRRHAPKRASSRQILEEYNRLAAMTVELHGVTVPAIRARRTIDAMLRGVDEPMEDA